MMIYSKNLFYGTNLQRYKYEFVVDGKIYTNLTPKYYSREKMWFIGNGRLLPLGGSDETDTGEDFIITFDGNYMNYKGPNKTEQELSLKIIDLNADTMVPCSDHITVSSMKTDHLTSNRILLKSNGSPSNYPNYYELIINSDNTVSARLITDYN